MYKEFMKGYKPGISDDFLYKILRNTSNPKLFLAILDNHGYNYKIHDFLFNENFLNNEQVVHKTIEVLERRIERNPNFAFYKNILKDLKSLLNYE